jgi:hypothetical protein
VPRIALKDGNYIDGSPKLYRVYFDGIAPRSIMHSISRHCVNYIRPSWLTRCNLVSTFPQPEYRPRSLKISVVDNRSSHSSSPRSDCMDRISTNKRPSCQVRVIPSLSYRQRKALEMTSGGKHGLESASCALPAQIYRVVARTYLLLSGSCILCASSSAIFISSAGSIRSRCTGGRSEVDSHSA